VILCELEERLWPRKAFDKLAKPKIPDLFRLICILCRCLRKHYCITVSLLLAGHRHRWCLASAQDFLACIKAAFWARKLSTGSVHWENIHNAER
jgi:hypothetical protein